MFNMLRPNHQIITLTLDHLNDVYNLERISHAYPWTIGVIKDCLTKYNCFAIFHLQSKQIIGYSVLQLILNEAHLLNLTIAPNYQKQGLGSDLLQFTLTKARKQQATSCFLEVAVNNNCAINLYNKHGFNQIGMRKNYYTNHKGDYSNAYVMALELI